MRVLTPLLFVLLTGSLQGQITIGQNEMPQAGSELVRNRANYPLFMNYAATGAGHVWNFNNLTVAGGNTTTYGSVSSTGMVYSLVYSDVFFNPNRANHAMSGLDIPLSELLPVEEPHTFFLRSATAYKKVGYGLKLEGFPVPVVMAEHDVVYQLPLHYGDTHTSNSRWELGLPTLAFYGYRQVRQNTVDGWGTLTTPSGTFDVLRVKTRIEGHDTIHVDTLSLGFTVDRPVMREYKWLAQGIRVPVLQVNTIEVLGTEVITEVFFYDQPRNLTVNEPLAAMLCPGSTSTLGYTATGVFNPSAFLVQGNSFRVQLSNAAGSFATPMVIGSVNGTTSGNINVTLPANTPPGTGYRVRLVSTSPAFTGPDNGYDLVVGTAPTALASASGPVNICVGGQVALHAEEEMGASYQWHDANGPIAGANDPDLIATATGSYRVMLTNPCGSSLSAPVQVTVTPLPTHAIAVGTPSVFCGQDAVQIEATNNSGQSGLVYTWYLDDVIIEDADGPTVTASTAGTYTLDVVNGTGCLFSVSHTLVLDPILSTIPGITVDGGTSFCAGGHVQLTYSGAAAVQWFQDGAPLPGANGTSLVVSESGMYHLVLTSGVGCTSEASAGVAVTVWPVPAPASIQSTDALAFCAGGAALLSVEGTVEGDLQWTLDGEPIPGATGTTWQATNAGSYAVVVTNTSGCSAPASTALVVTVHALPTAPVITQAGHVLTATGTGDLQWYFDGDVIDGATGAAHTATADGLYSVVVTDANGCSNTSGPFNFSTVGMQEIGTAAFRVWPNPTNGSVQLRLERSLQNAHLTVSDATGRTILQDALTAPLTTIDLQSLPVGLYLITVRSSELYHTVRVVRQ